MKRILALIMADGMDTSFFHATGDPKSADFDSTAKVMYTTKAIAEQKADIEKMERLRQAIRSESREEMDIVKNAQVVLHAVKTQLSITYRATSES